MLLVAVAYKKAFGVAIETRDYRNELIEKLALAENADGQIRSQQVQIALLDKYLGEEDNTIEKVQQGFLNFFAKYGEHLLVNRIDEVLNFKHPDFEINTHCIVLRGDYVSTIEFIYTLEKDFSLAKILNVAFEFKRESMEEEKHLYTTLLIQNYLR